MNTMQRTVLSLGLLVMAGNAAMPPCRCPAQAKTQRYLVVGQGLPSEASVDLGSLLAQTLFIGCLTLAVRNVFAPAPSQPNREESAGPRFPPICPAGFPPEPDQSVTRPARSKRSARESSSSNSWEPFVDLDPTGPTAPRAP